jgi:hypothetical protein
MKGIGKTTAGDKIDLSGDLAASISAAIRKADKKRIKAEYKLRKKELKAGSKGGVIRSKPARTSGFVRFAEGVRGIIYIILGVSLALAIILGQTGVIITLDDIVRNLFVAIAGKVVLGIIAIALVIYGFKNLRIMK